MEGRAAARREGARSFHLLSAQDFALNRIGEPDAAALRRDLAVLLEQQRAVDGLGLPAAEQRIVADAVEHMLEDLRQKECLEVLARLVRGLGVLQRARSGRLCRIDGPGDRRRYGIAGVHHKSSISAWSAPDALIAWRMLIMSRGPTPSAFKLLTSSCKLTPAGSTAMRRSACSSTLTSVRGTTTVCPPPPGANCTPSRPGASGSSGACVVGGVVLAF